jgi:hypothetical protein
VTENVTFFSEKLFFSKVIGNGLGVVWACFGTASRCFRVNGIMPRSSIAWKTMDDRDQKHAKTGSKTTLFQSDCGVSGETVEVF